MNDYILNKKPEPASNETVWAFADWVRDIRAQCHRAKVAFFFKQWGGVRKKETGRELDDRTYDEFPECPQIPVPGLEIRRNTLERLELV